MSTRIEVDIAKLILEHKHLDLVADQLVRKWEDSLLTEDEINSIATFLFNAGFFSSLMSLSVKSLLKSQPVPWKFMGEIFSGSLSRLSSDLATALINCAEEETKLTELALSSCLDKYDPRLTELRENHFKKIQKDYIQKRDDLLEKVQILRSQRLLKEEQKTLLQLERLFPLDNRVKQEQMITQENWAKEFISEKSSALKSRNTLRRSEDSDDIAKTKKTIIRRINDELKKHPALAYDMAIMLCGMDLHKEALQVLKNATHSKAKDWLELELIIETELFVEALDRVLRLEIEYAHDPETNFAVNYARARALWSLGQKEKAIEVMQSIVNVNPNYRSSLTLLNEWSGGRS